MADLHHQQQRFNALYKGQEPVRCYETFKLSKFITPRVPQLRKMSVVAPQEAKAAAPRLEVKVVLSFSFNPQSVLVSVFLCFSVIHIHVEYLTVG